MIDRITLIGAGRVGGALARRFRTRDLRVGQVYSRTPARAEAVAREVDAQPISQLDELHPDADLYLLAVPDDAIETVAHRLASQLPRDVRIAHCSGATPLAVLTAHFPRAGIFYPLQSFVGHRAPDWNTLPLCVHATSEPGLEALAQLARRIAEQVHRVNDTQRAALHVAAVFVNNFTNHLYGVGEQLTRAADLPFALLLPLIRETTARLGTTPARQLQTGPAARGDTRTMQRHLALLAGQPAYQALYRVLSDAIAGPPGPYPPGPPEGGMPGGKVDG